MRAVVVSFDQPVENFYRGVTEDGTLVMLWCQESTHGYMRRKFGEWGVDLDHCEFHRVPSLPVPRDKLPWFMFVDHDEPAFVYNQDYRGLEYCMPSYGLELGYPVYRSGLGLEGGDFMTDGQGTAVSLDGFSIFNAEMGDELARRVRDYWGVHTFHFIANDRWGMNRYQHIDCLAKFLSPDTVMVVRVPPSDVRRKQSEETAAYFRRQVSCYGTPYEVVRVDVPNREPYINSVIFNRKVFVPILDVEADARAIASYEAAMPGYEVIGVGGANMWQPFFALHCHTMGLADAQMLYIEHTPVLDRPSTSEGLPIDAKIVAHSQREFVQGTPAVRWRARADGNKARLASEPWNTVAMAREPKLGDDRYLAYIPAQPVGTVVQYYLRARDASGRDETHPYIGEAQAHTFTVRRLGANVSAVSARRGGTIQLYVNVGVGNARRAYRLTYSPDADSEAPESESATLPETTVLSGFDGTLDEFGIASARMTISEPLSSDWVGRSLLFSLELDDQQDATPETVRVLVLE
jgi:hypothetical protein